MIARARRRRLPGRTLALTMRNPAADDIVDTRSSTDSEPRMPNATL
jgi:hypothetical protein